MEAPTCDEAFGAHDEWPREENRRGGGLVGSMSYLMIAKTKRGVRKGGVRANTDFNIDIEQMDSGISYPCFNPHSFLAGQVLANPCLGSRNLSQLTARTGRHLPCSDTGGLRWRASSLQKTQSRLRCLSRRLPL